MERQAKRVFTNRSILILSVAILLFATVACAPRAAPSPPPAKSPSLPGAAPGAAPALPMPEKTAWEKLVQAAKQEGSVTIYSYNMRGDIALAVSRAFKEKYGISVDIISGRGAELAERIRTEQRTGQVAADIMDAIPTHLYTLKDANFTMSSADIPVLQEKDAWLVDPRVADEAGHILVHSLLSYSAFINTKLVKAGDEPRSLRELTQPKWSGKMVMHDPTFSSAAYVFYYTLLRHKFTDLETVRAVGRNNMKFAVNLAEAAMEVGKGNYAIHPGAPDVGYAPLVREGAPVKAIALEEGTVVNGNAFAAINKAPHPNVAKLFVNWLLTPEGQTMFLKDQYILSPRKNMPDFRPEASRIAPIRLIATNAEDEKENAQAFRDKLLVKLWKE